MKKLFLMFFVTTICVASVSAKEKFSYFSVVEKIAIQNYGFNCELEKKTLICMKSDDSGFKLTEKIKRKQDKLSFEGVGSLRDVFAAPVIFTNRREWMNEDMARLLFDVRKEIVDASIRGEIAKIRSFS